MHFWYLNSKNDDDEDDDNNNEEEEDLKTRTETTNAHKWLSKQVHVLTNNNNNNRYTALCFRSDRLHGLRGEKIEKNHL